MTSDGTYKFAPKRESIFVILALIPFFANDLLFLVSEGAPQWLAIDYATKIVVLALLLGPSVMRAIALQAEPTQMRLYAIVLFAMLAFGLALASDHYVRGWLDYLLPQTILFSYPPIGDPALYWFDMTFGLALTAVSEELAFRKVLWHWLRPRLASTTTLYFLSAALFGLCHWSHGVGSVVSAFLIGLVLMGLYRRTGRIEVSMAVHYATLFILFYR